LVGGICRKFIHRATYKPEEDEEEEENTALIEECHSETEPTWFFMF